MTALQHLHVRRAVPLRLALALLVPCAAGGVVACAPRAVQVSSGPAPASAGLSFTNNLKQAVNVYVRGPSGAEIFVRQVAAQSTESIVVPNVAPGTRVSMRVAPVDGSSGYTRDGVALGAGSSVTIP